MYEVQTPQFKGPLHVLLELTEERKLEITEISLAEVTQQFLDYLKTLKNIDPNILTDFLTVASKLLVIKSKSLLPTLEEELEEDEKATDLTYQLLQFKKFKLVAKYLKELEATGNYSFVREGTAGAAPVFIPDPHVNSQRLAEAMRSLARSLEEITKIPKEVVKEVVSITDKINHLRRLISEKLELKLTDALQKNSRTEIVVTFLALLELIKQKILSVEQEALFGDIKIKKRDA